MLSDIEHKLLVVIFGLSLMLATVRTGGWFVEAYNEHVASVERERYLKATGGPKISFAACTFGSSTALFELILGLQMPILLFGFLSFCSRRTEGVAFSALAPAVLLLAFVAWAYSTFIGWSNSEALSYMQPSYSSYLLYGSTFADWSLLIIIFILFFSLAAVLVRTTVERFFIRKGLHGYGTLS